MSKFKCWNWSGYFIKFNKLAIYCIKAIQKYCIKETILFIQLFNIWWAPTRFQILYCATCWGCSGGYKPLTCELYLIKHWKTKRTTESCILGQVKGECHCIWNWIVRITPWESSIPKAIQNFFFWQVQKYIPLVDIDGLPLS